MMDDFFQQHRTVSYLLVGIILMISGRLDAKLNSLFSANFNWFLGGTLSLGAATYLIMSNVQVIGNIAKPIAVFVFLFGPIGIWLYRPKK